MARTLVFSFDGTGNEPSDVTEFKEDESITNILKLHIMMGGGMAVDLTPTRTRSGNEQRTFYYNGIGTREGAKSIPLLGWIRSKINMALAPSVGDARRILNEALDDFDIAGYGHDEDKLVVFGFSRGAALARKFVSLLLSANEEAKVDFLGVYDTVAAMNGIHRSGEQVSSDVFFENGTLHPHVKRAVHLVSLDEDRVPFTPTLINTQRKDENRILELWLPGVHSDVGGGYWMDGLSDSALKLMIDECRNALREDISINDSPADIHRLLAAQGDQLADITVDDVVVRPLHRGVLHVHSEGLVSKVAGREPRLVHVAVDDRPARNRPPLVHNSVKRRFMDVAGYRPPALRGVSFTLVGPDGSSNVDGIGGLI